MLGIACGALLTGLGLPAIVGERPEQATDVGAAAGSDVDGSTQLDGQTGGTDSGSESSDVGVGNGDGATSDASATAGGGTAGSDGGRSSGQATGGGAADQGVFPDRIKLGLLLTDLSNPTGLQIGPGVEVEEQQKQWQAVIDELNEDGGVGGRRIEPVFRAATILDKDQMLATCAQLAKDDKVFAVLDAGGAAIGEIPQCYTAEHGLPLLAGGAAGLWDDSFANSRGLLFIMHLRGSRLMRSFAAELTRSGRLKGKTCGIVADQFQGASPKGGEALENELEQRGCKVARRDTLSGDLPTGSSQIPVVVQQMRTNGVDSVMLLANPVYATQFVQNAEGQGYRPDYNLTDWLGGTTDFGVQNLPAQAFERVAGVSSGRLGEARADIPEIPEAVRCREIYERRTGQRLNRAEQGYNLTQTACAELQLCAKAAGSAGSDLTRAAFAGALSRLGAFTPGYQSPGSFTPGKPDLADGVRTVIARDSCKCWIATGQFHQHG